MSKAVQLERIRTLNGAPVHAGGRYVLYWMIAARRLRHSHALDRAVEHARALGRPLLVFEPLRVDYPYACDRFHAFVIDGMRDNAREAAAAGVRDLPYVESRPGEGRGLLRALAREACVVVTDDHPAFHYPAMLDAASRQVARSLEAVDGNGLVPMRSAGRAFPTAFGFRRHLKRVLPSELRRRPTGLPLRRLAGLPRAIVPRKVLRRWPSNLPDAGALPIDHAVGPTRRRGGPAAGRRALSRFLRDRLASYDTARNHPDENATSGLSPYLHFGHIGAAEVYGAVHRRAGGSAPAEAFLDQLVTWRELGFNMCALRPNGYQDFDALPDWARRTLGEHWNDSRPYLYALEDFERAQTHDELWNAAQRQLVGEGRIHNYLRMLWGKKILEWSISPVQALEVMIHLNDKYALDGRDPNSYSGIFWVLGRYDRAWGPERPVFGKVRYMSSANARRKLRLRAYLERYA